MNVYVVSNLIYGGDTDVVGAAADREAAERLADRFKRIDDGNPWSPWREDVCPGEGNCVWSRHAVIDGTVLATVSQEIICLPLTERIAP